MIDLFRSENVLVRSVPAADVSRWVVTFDHYGIGHGFDRPGFGQEFLRAEGISAIHVMGVREDWYQYSEMAEAMKVVRAAVAGADRVMTYGSSMGGYAAVRFADAAGANAVLAISPQYSIDPKKAPFEKRWPQESRRTQWLPEIDGRLSSRCRPVIVYDPTGDDGRHVRLIASEIDIQDIPVRYGGHPVTTSILETGLIKKLFEDTFSGALDVAAFLRDVRSSRRMSSTYFSQLADAQPPHRSDLALALAKQAHALQPNSAIALASYATKLTAQGRHEEALDLHRHAVNVSERNHNCLIHYANALAAASYVDEAVQIAAEVVEKVPHMAILRRWQAGIFEKRGAWREAIEAIEQAMLLDPRAAHLRKARAIYQRRLRLAEPGVRGDLYRRAHHWFERAKFQALSKFSFYSPKLGGVGKRRCRNDQ